MSRRKQRLVAAGGVLVAVLAVGGSVALASSRDGRRLECVSASSTGAMGTDASFRPKLSADGRFVAFLSRAGNLVEGDTNSAVDVFVRDRVTNTTERANLSSAPGNLQPSAGCTDLAISGDGRIVAFVTQTGSLVGGDTNGANDVFVRDRQTGATRRISVSSADAQGNGPSTGPSLSADGRFVAFESAATTLVTGDTNGNGDIFVRDRQSLTTERVSVSLGTTNNQATGGNSTRASISGDGRFVAFQSDATNLVLNDTNNTSDIFLRDRTNNTTIRISVASNGSQANGASTLPSMSESGRFVAYRSLATNLVPNDTNGFADIFVYDVLTGTTERVSVAEWNANEANADSDTPSISGDGTFIVFQSGASNLAFDDQNQRADIFIRDRLKGRTDKVSTSVLHAQADQDCTNPVISASGQVIGFDYTGTSLFPGDTNNSTDVLVAWDALQWPAHIAVYRPGSPSQWFLRDFDGSPTVVPFGGPTDVPVPADYRGTGRAQIGVFRPSNQTWFIRRLDGSPTATVWGDAADNIPVPADYLGLGWSQIAVYKPANQTWLIRKGDDGSQASFSWGATGDIPVPADYFGMGKVQIAVYRPSTGEFFIRGDGGRSSIIIPFGAPGDLPVPGNYFHDGSEDGHDLIAVFRPSTGEFFIREESGARIRIPFGAPGDKPVPAEYGVSGAKRIAVYRPSLGAWFILNDDILGVTRIDWGGPIDLPVPAPYRVGTP